MNIEQWLNTLVPLPQIVQIVDKVLPAFIIVALMIAIIGYQINLIAAESVYAPTGKLIVLLACIAGATWMLGIAQDIVKGVVGAVADASPNMGWIRVNNPNSTATSPRSASAHQFAAKE